MRAVTLWEGLSHSRAVCAQGPNTGPGMGGVGSEGGAGFAGVSCLLQDRSADARPAGPSVVNACRLQEWLKTPAPGIPFLPAPPQQVAFGSLSDHQRNEQFTGSPALGEQQAGMDVVNSLLVNGSNITPPCELGIDNETLFCLDQPHPSKGTCQTLVIFIQKMIEGENSKGKAKRENITKSS